MLFKNILVPHDGSGNSKHAFKVALDMAKKYNSKISMVTVLDMSPGYWDHANLWDKAIGLSKISTCSLLLPNNNTHPMNN